MLSRPRVLLGRKINQRVALPLCPSLLVLLIALPARAKETVKLAFIGPLTGTIRGGLNVNSVPDEVVIGIDIRTVPGQHH